MTSLSKPPIPYSSSVHRASIRSKFNLTLTSFVVLSFLHVLLGIAIFQFRWLSTAHVYAVLIAAGLIGLSMRLSPIISAYAISYLVGSELIWRMTSAQVFYEIGKYSVVMMIGLTLLRTRNHRIPVLPLLYFLFMLPSTLLTLEHFSLGDAREYISFNLSGPLVLFMSAWFYSTLRVTWQQLRSILLFTILPVVTIVTFLLLNLLSLDVIIWRTSSNFSASGGFGPNQISTILGLASLICMFVLLTLRSSRGWWLILSALALWFLGHALLTFSRGGVFAAGLAFLFFMAHVVVTNMRKALAIGLTLLLFIPLGTLVFSSLDQFTNGMLSLRFAEADFSNRDQIALNELDLFLEQPITGLGPGVSGTQRLDALEGSNVTTHTEFTRLLVDHGILGIGSGIIMISLFIQRYRKQPTASYRGLMGGIMAWSIMSMFHSAMRIAAIPWSFGLAFIEIIEDE